MEPQELQESTEHAQHKGEKGIGLTTAIVAVLLAVATQLSHRAHTEEIKLMTKVADSWAFYQAKHNRAHTYGKYAEDEALHNEDDLAVVDLKRSIAEECGAPVEENCTSPILRDSPATKHLLERVNGDTKPEHGVEGQGGGKPSKGDTSPTQHKAAKGGSGRREGAVDIEEHSRELEKETDLITTRANVYDISELLLSVSIVLCSIALLAEAKIYWRLSFVTTAIGLAIALWGWFLH